AAPEPGPQWTDRREVALVASHALADVDAADVLVVPGGFGTRPLLTDQTWLDWVQRVHETTQWTTSVCTGSLLLGAAGLLDGLEATTHWQELETLRRFGATPTSRRVVRQGKIVTAAGVSSGIDMALSLASWIAGDDVAQAIQLSIEYDPPPPLDSGSPAKAPAGVVSLRLPQVGGGHARLGVGRQQPGCARRAGEHRHHVDTGVAHLVPERLGQHQVPGLGGGIAGDERRSAQGGARSQEDHAAAATRHHRGQQRVDER